VVGPLYVPVDRMVTSSRSAPCVVQVSPQTLPPMQLVYQTCAHDENGVCDDAANEAGVVVTE
jgi:hypothetical protein